MQARVSKQPRSVVGIVCCTMHATEIFNVYIMAKQSMQVTHKTGRNTAGRVRHALSPLNGAEPIRFRWFFISLPYGCPTRVLCFPDYCLIVLYAFGANHVEQSWPRFAYCVPTVSLCFSYNFDMSWDVAGQNHWYYIASVRFTRVMDPQCGWNRKKIINSQKVEQLMHLCSGTARLLPWALWGLPQESSDVHNRKTPPRVLGRPRTEDSHMSPWTSTTERLPQEPLDVHDRRTPTRALRRPRLKDSRKGPSTSTADPLSLPPSRPAHSHSHHHSHSTQGG